MIEIPRFRLFLNYFSYQIFNGYSSMGFVAEWIIMLDRDKLIRKFQSNSFTIKVGYS